MSSIPSPARLAHAVALAALLVGAPAARAQDVTALLPPVASAGPNYGLAVAVDGDTALVGARFATHHGDGAGAAYVFTRDAAGAWSTPVELVPANGAPGDLFGWAVALQGDTAFVGAPSDDSETFAPLGMQAGSVYVFDRDANGAWSQRAKLRATKELSSNQFGCALDVDGALLAVGARWSNVSGLQIAGSAYVFAEVGGVWTAEQQLVASDAAETDQFGEAVSVSGETVVVGSKAHDHSAFNTNHGAAYVFVRGAAPGTWVEQAELRAASPQLSDNLGRALSLDGERLVVGAPGNGAGVVDSGSALVFERTGDAWSQTAELLPNAGAADDRFGHALSLHGDRVIVGAYFRDDAATNAGAGYVFERSAAGDWSRQAKFLAPGGGPGDRLGIALASDGAWLLLGASGAAALGADDTGAAYALPLAALTPWADAEHALAGSALAPSLVGFGALLPDAPTELRLTGAQPDASVFLVLGASELGAAFKGGVLVPEPAQVLARRADLGGGLSLRGRWPDGVPSGAQLFAQVWVVDEGAPFGYAASNALAATAP